jgi:hypothetical protein
MSRWTWGPYWITLPYLPVTSIHCFATGTYPKIVDTKWFGTKLKIGCHRYGAYLS